MGPRQIWRDLRRIARGVVGLVGYLKSHETIDVALGMFEAASSAMVAGQPCRYVIRIANVSEKVWDGKVTVEISSTAPVDPDAKGAARFAKHCTIPPRRAAEMEFRYDWRNTAAFMVDEVISDPDECCVSEIKAVQRYVIRVRLADHAGNHLDQLDIYQELKG